MQGAVVQSRECVFCFRRADCEEGLFVALDDVSCVCKDHIKTLEKAKKTTNHIYLNFSEISIDINDSDEFQNQSSEKHRTFSVYNSQTGELKPPDSEKDSEVFSIIEIIEKSLDYFTQKTAQQAATWGQDPKRVFNNSENLFQIENPPMLNIRDENLKCEACDKVENLWLNLSDGKILCGRKYFDGSGGNNHAIQHYKITKYPLAVKIGTICPDLESIDVFSYENNDTVIDPCLEKHLKYFGIDCSDITKTEKSTQELEIEFNHKRKTFKQEALTDHIPVKPQKSFVGLSNIGNTCYMDAILQILARIDSIQEVYVQNSDHFFLNSSLDFYSDFNLQLSKILITLVEEVVIDLPKHQDSWLKIEPNIFKLCIGNFHPEFSSAKQQDCCEFMLFLLQFIEQHQSPNTLSSCNACRDLSFHSIETIETHKTTDLRIHYGYVLIPDIMYPDENTINLDFIEYLHLFVSETSSGADLNNEAMPSSSFQLAYLPKYLCVCVKRFSINQKTFMPKKAKISLHYPFDDLNQPVDLSFLCAKPEKVQKAIEEQYSQQSKGKKEEFSLEKEVQSLPDFKKEWIGSLQAMGFITDEKTVNLVKKESDLEQVVQKITSAAGQENLAGNEHLNQDYSESAFLDPEEYSFVNCSEENVNILNEMGYSKLSIINALKRNDNSIEKALEFLLQNNDSSHAMEEPKNNLPPKSFNSNKLSAEHFKIKLENNSSNLFHIKAFVVHKGRSINFGHYIAYIKQTDPSTGLDAWFEFNDEKVKLLQSNPPFAEAYLVFLEQAKN